MTRPDRQIERFTWAIQISPFVVAIILAALWIAGAPPSVPDLRLSAPVVARPGATIGLRAWQVAEAEDGYTVIASPPVSVELRNATGLRLASTELFESKVEGREGHLTIPTELDDVLSLVATATIDGREVSVERALYVRDSIESRLPAGRSVNAFQAYELGPIRSPDQGLGLDVLDPRIEEGACVPGLRCWLSVWVGDRDVRVRLRPLAGVRLEATVAQSEGQLARFPIVVTGQEGRIDVEALGPNGGLVSAREVRLPVIPGGLVARVSMVGEEVELDWKQLGEPRPVLVDVFRGRRWARALSLSPGDRGLPRLGPGVWRLQLRSDLMSDNTAAVSYVVIADADGPGTLRQAADAVLADAARDGLDPLALAVVDGEGPDEGSERALRALFAVPSFDVVAIGPGMSSRVGVDRTLEREQARRRWLAAAAILVIGFLVSMVLLRVEITSQAHARELLDQLGDTPSTPLPNAAPGRGLWAFVLFVFVLIAVLALSKGWF
jgi:hypothetical protein